MRPFSPGHVVFLQKGWQAFSGFVTAVLVMLFLSPEEQGYYYAIGSLLSGHVLLDLGLSGLLVQLAARSFAGLKIGAGGAVEPPGEARSALAGMIAWSLRWYAGAGAMALLLIPLGLLYFGYARSGPHPVAWQWPWIAAVVAVAAGMPAYPALSIVEGAGRVTEAYLVRLAHYALGAVLAWALIAAGFGLYAPAMAPLAVALVVYRWAGTRYRGLFVAARRDGDGFSWREQVWPLQKRVALTWLAAYLFLNSPTLTVFYFVDAVSAGRLGLSIIVANILSSLCASWLIARVPQMTRLVAEGRPLDSRRLFLKEFRKACLLMAVAYAAAVAVVEIGEESPLGQRILPPLELAMLFAVFMVFHAAAMLALYFRARGQEVLAMPVMAATLGSLLLSCAMAKSLGVMGVLGAFVAIYGAVGVVAMRIVWRRRS